MKKTTPRYMIIKFLKTNNKERILKAATEEQIKKIADFLFLNSAKGNSVVQIFKVLKEKNLSM